VQCPTRLEQPRRTRPDVRQPGGRTRIVVHSAAGGVGARRHLIIGATRSLRRLP
jgi:hypothetical protein